MLPVFQAQGQKSDGGAMRGDVVARLTEFYKLYCHALKVNDSLLDRPGRLTPYVSTRFLKEIDRLSKVEGGIEADPFVCAQDNDPKWENDIRVKNVKAASAGDTASADVTLVGGTKDMTVHLRVSFVNEAGVYKVDKVKNTAL